MEIKSLENWLTKMQKDKEFTTREHTIISGCMKHFMAEISDFAECKPMLTNWGTREEK